MYMYKILFITYYELPTYCRSFYDLHQGGFTRALQIQ